VKKFVLDVNAWVSVFYRDKHLKLIKLIEEEEIDIFTSEENISEFADVHAKHKKIAKLLPLHTSVYVEAMEEICEMYLPQKRYALLPDYKDNYLVDLAHQTRAILVTDDKHFKIAKTLKSPKITIVGLGRFYEMLNL
jgi:putative PIN family toxin of toxin-antitoxin system